MAKIKHSEEESTIQITLRVPKKIYKKLQNEMKNFAYPAIQSIILESLRERYFKKPKEKSKNKQ